MFKDIKWIKVIVIMTVSLIVLFGGWFLYQNLSVKNPIMETLGTIDGIKLNEVEIKRDTIKLNISLDKVDNFQATYHEIKKNIQPYLKKQQLDITIDNKINLELAHAWNQSYFHIAEAIDQHQYSIIPETIENLRLKLKLDKAGYSMDEKYIYIDLHQDNSSLYVILPRDNAKEAKSLG